MSIKKKVRRYSVSKVQPQVHEATLPLQYYLDDKVGQLQFFQSNNFKIRQLTDSVHIGYSLPTIQRACQLLCHLGHLNFY